MMGPGFADGIARRGLRLLLIVWLVSTAVVVGACLLAGMVFHHVVIHWK
jgi:hypothetical protein